MKLPFKVNDFHPGFMSMTEIGIMFGVSSHVIGRWLYEIGWRTVEGRPCPEAFNRDLIKPTHNGRNGGYYYIWHVTKTIEALKEAGHERVD